MPSPVPQPISRARSGGSGSGWRRRQSGEVLGRAGARPLVPAGSGLLEEAAHRRPQQRPEERRPGDDPVQGPPDEANAGRRGSGRATHPGPFSQGVPCAADGEAGEISAQGSQPRPFEVDGRLAGDELGEGPAVVLLHGVTATRGQVVHGSTVLAREGLRMVRYDARGHGESEPAPQRSGYGCRRTLTISSSCSPSSGEGAPFILAGHSMGAHTAVGYALRAADRLAGLVVIGPVYRGPPENAEQRQQTLDHWDELADGLEQGGVDGFSRRSTARASTRLGATRCCASPASACSSTATRRRWRMRCARSLARSRSSRCRSWS